MPKIQAGTDPNMPYARHTFWTWELINIFIPLIGILFFDWHIFTLVLIFWWEVFCWGCVGVLKILSSNVAESVLDWFTGRFIWGAAFAILYGGLMLILISFSFTEFDTESMITVRKGIRWSLAIIGANYLVEYIRSELVTGRYRTRFYFEVIFERFVYALPLVCLILFAVIPLSERFKGERAEMIIGIGILLSKFIIDIAVHYLPGLVFQLEDINESMRMDIEETDSEE